jgi:hypothetical protein
MFLFSENLAVYDIKGTNKAQPERAQVKI